MPAVRALRGADVGARGGGAIDPDEEAHDLIVSVFGRGYKGEGNRLEVQAHAAMSAGR